MGICMGCKAAGWHSIAELEVDWKHVMHAAFTACTVKPFYNSKAFVNTFFVFAETNLFAQVSER